MFHAIYRYCGKENEKPRAPFYHKIVCLKSFVNALGPLAGARLTFLADGAIPTGVQSLLPVGTEIIKLPDVGLTRSFLHAIEIAALGKPDELTYLVEDDYLHLPDGLVKLQSAHDSRFADYLTLYDDPLRYERSQDVSPDLPLPDPLMHVVGEHHWRVIESTTFTFAASAGTIARDIEIFRNHVHRGTLNPKYIMDRESWREIQGLGDYSSRSHKGRLSGAIPSLATHCESTSLSPAIDWFSFAAKVRSEFRGTFLALDGSGSANEVMVPPPMPGALEIGEEEERAVINVIRSQRLGRYGSPWNTPSRVEELELRFARHIGVEHCLAVSSGTAALHCALVGLGIGPGDEVIIPAYTWMGTATTVCHVGAVPVIADIDETLNLDPASVEAAISPFTRAIIVVHMRGAPARLDALMAIARSRGIAIVEDVAQAMGGTFHAKRLGTIGDLGCFSMQTYKILTTGEGGFVVARDRNIYERLTSFHGAPYAIDASPWLSRSVVG